MGDNSTNTLRGIKESEMKAVESSDNYRKRKNELKREEHGVTETCSRWLRRAAPVLAAPMPAESTAEGSLLCFVLQASEGWSNREQRVSDT